MTKDKTVTMSRELIEVVAKEMDRLGYGRHEHHAESILHAIRSAAPVVERQEPVKWERKSKMHDGNWYPLPVEDVDEARHNGYEVRALYTSPPAPVAVRKLEMADVVRAHMEIPNCPVMTSNQCHALAVKLNACLDKVKELNQ